MRYVRRPMRLPISLTIFALLGACAREAEPRTTIQNTAARPPGTASSCASAVATMVATARASDPTRNAWNEETESNLKAVLANRCVEDQWTAEARACLEKANSKDALDNCWAKQLSGDQRHRADRVAMAIEHASRRDSSGDDGASSNDPAVAAAAMAAARDFADRICACADHKDQECFKKVQDDMQHWAADNADKMKDYKPTEDEMKDAQDVAQKMAACMQKVMQ
jgi:hypothetical protein